MNYYYCYIILFLGISCKKRNLRITLVKYISVSVESVEKIDYNVAYLGIEIEGLP